MQPLIVRGVARWGDDLSAHSRPLYTAVRVLRAPARGALTLDLDGYVLAPALANAHDHLELNHYPRTKYRDRYDSAHDWGVDVSARLHEAPLAALRAYPLADRCFIGGLKNLLSGVLTVAQHNPPHRCLFARGFPVRVLRRYGWAHSLYFTPETALIESYRRTPLHRPWFIHLAEGSDAAAADEYRRLKALGCVGANTVIVHGVGLMADDAADAARRIRAWVLCPTTNDYLLGNRPAPDALAAYVEAGGALALGSDSRLTAAGDLLDEYRAASGDLPSLVRGSARLLGLPPDPLRVGAPADLMLYARAHAAAGGLPTGGRAHLALVVRSGAPQIGDPDLMARFTRVQSIPARLDGQPKRIALPLARQIARCSLQEPGLELDPDFAARYSTPNDAR